VAQLWYVSTDGRTRLGPYSASSLRSMARSGRLKPGDLVMPKGQPKWSKAGRVPGLFPAPEPVEVWPVEDEGDRQGPPSRIKTLRAAVAVVWILVLMSACAAGAVAIIKFGPKIDPSLSAPELKP
jgi:hypothetical protein